LSTQEQLDKQNATFWNELCGTSFAQALGITGTEPDALERYDSAFLDYYPYLAGYVTRFGLDERRTLEIGLGYGTLGGLLLERGADYHGLDISPGPVEMMRHRLRLRAVPDPESRVVVGSALNIPHPPDSFDFLYTIGCLHHTGHLARAIDEVHRVLVSGGTAIVMVYNRRSFRQIVRVDLPRLTRRARLRSSEAVRSLYDTNLAGDAAPHTEYVTKREVDVAFGRFSKVTVDRHNFDEIVRRGRIVVSRDRILGTTIERLLGLDLYVVAKK